MWLPKQIYERIPQFYILAGLLLITDGAYLGSEVLYFHSYFYFGLGFAILIYGFGILTLRESHRKAKRASQTGSEDVDSAAAVEEIATSPEAPTSSQSE